jgi:hypothetical protein
LGGEAAFLGNWAIAGSQPVSETRFGQLRARTVALWQRVQNPARFVLLALVLVVLWRDLAAIGWGALAHHLPTTPWFYAIFIINYLSLPFYEVIIYHWLWRTGPGVLPALLRKRVFNEAVLEYSGETALFVWAKNHTGVPDRDVFGNIRDVNILSVLAANLVTVVVLVVVVFGAADRLGVGDAAMLRQGMMMSGGVGAVLVVLAVVFRRRFLSMTLGKMAGISGLHTLRLCTWMVLQATQWHVAVPQVGWNIWAIFIALQMAVGRLPLIPAKELFFAGLAIKLGEKITLAPAMVAGLFLASSGLNMIVHGVMYVVGHLFGPKAPAQDQADGKAWQREPVPFTSDPTHQIPGSNS